MEKPQPITPLILGTGRSGHAIARSLAAIAVSEPDLGLGAPVWLRRGDNIAVAARTHSRPFLCVANPHGLHARAILDADAAGLSLVVCEKPTCVSLEEVDALANVKIPVAVLHVYRQTWGAQQLRSMIRKGELGQIIAIEGRYWQASAAERARAETPPAPGWKDDVALSGPSDTLLDVGVHWIDMACHLLGGPPQRSTIWRSYAAAPSPHRDSHVQVTLDFGAAGRAFASISKIAHGATNHFEVVALGTQGSAKWAFLAPDEIEIGEGRNRRVVTRASTDHGSKQPAFHGLGWLEGYVEILRQSVREAFTGVKGEYPRLPENLAMMRAVLSASST